VRPAAFLDRDGVLNRPKVVDGRPYPPDSVAELELLDGVEAACSELHDAGLALVVVSNQPDVARGTRTLEEVEAINDELRRLLPLDQIRICPHDDDACACRKPAPGMLLDAAAELEIDLERSVMVGDRWRDIEAGKSANCATVFLDWGYSERPPEDPDLIVRSLGEAVPWILDQLLKGRPGHAHSR
jgi:D-glycero-D-manno-heptose 1,7-bisphosphate phosphatase